MVSKAFQISWISSNDILLIKIRGIFDKIVGYGTI